MLPWDNSRKMPAIVSPGDSDDLAGEAVKRTMSKLINAIQAQNVNDAVEAWKILCALESAEEY